MKKLRKILPLLVLTVPALAHAQFISTSNLIARVGEMVNNVTLILAALALLVFFLGLVRFIFAAGSEVDKQKGKDLMIWGIVALFVMTSVWGIIYFIGDELFPGVNYTAPSIQNLIPTR